jgi:hypothetical protein
MTPIKTAYFLAALVSAAPGLAQSTATAPAKLVVTNAFILTMSKDQREPVKGYMVVGEDGRLLTVAAGDPPAGLQAKEKLDAGVNAVTAYVFAAPAPPCR